MRISDWSSDVCSSDLVTAIGLVVGGVLFVVARALINDLRPQFIILATPGNVARAIVAGALMALIAAVIPARRLAVLEPTAAYRSEERRVGKEWVSTCRLRLAAYT